MEWNYEEHVEQCDVDRQTFDGICPMCGQKYEDYMGHLRNDCDGDGDEQGTEAAGIGDGVRWRGDPLDENHLS